MVNIAQVRAAVQKLKQINYNWLYVNIDDGSVDDASRRTVNSVSDTTRQCTMLVKVTADDVKSFQSYTIRRLDQKQSSLTDSEHYKLMNVNKNALSNKLKHLDVLCFPTLFPSGRFGESHDHSTPISLSEFVKSHLLNRDSWCFTITNMILRCYPNVSAILRRHTKSCLLCFFNNPYISPF